MNQLKYSVVSKSPETNTETLVFIHGWPDDSRLWAHLVDALSHRCRCVTVTLPGFDTGHVERGLDFLEIVQQLRALILKLQSSHGAKPVILIGHDWGAYIAYLFEHHYPELVDRMVTMDVGGRIAPSGPGHAAFLAAYQWWLISAWAIGKRLPKLGDWMSRSLAKSLGSPRVQDIHSDMNYPYFYFWRHLLSLHSRLLKSYSPKRPLLYLYGEAKPYMFHSPGWLELLAKRKDCAAIGFQGAGHWLMLDKPVETRQAIEDWVW